MRDPNEFPEENSIKLIREPKIYKVAGTVIHSDSIASYLDDQDATVYQPDEMSHSPEVLTEVAGRLCYNSWSKPRPGGTKALCERLLSEGHGCYDEKTDVLTSDGWKPWPNVTMSDYLATLDENNFVVYQKPTALLEDTYEGRMYQVKSKNVDLFVTPNHNMLVCRTTTLEGRRKQKFLLEKAQDLDGVSHCYTKTGLLQDDKLIDTNYYIAWLLGFAIGDGSIVPRTTTLRFHLRKERKIQALKFHVQQVNWAVIEDAANDRYNVKIPNEWLSFFHEIYTETKEKQIPRGILTGWQRPALQGLYNGLMEADGHRGKNSDCFDTTSQVLVNQFQQLCLHIGVSANIGYTYGPEDRPTSFGTKPLTRLYIQQNSKPEFNKFNGNCNRTEWIENWRGKIYCAQVPNSTLYVRRNGIPVWSGNSTLEHSSWSFLCSGVSRSLTHELVRHRSGMAYSQRSQRYVDESLAAFVVPFDIANDPQCLIWFAEVAVIASRNYAKIADRLIQLFTEKLELPATKDQQTAIRKRARGNARSVMPNATETQILVTGNGRAFRNAIEQRGSRFADREIRMLLNLIYDVLIYDAPYLFGDYVLTPLEDGTREMVTQWRKV